MIIKCEQKHTVEINDIIKYFNTSISDNHFDDNPYSIFLAHISNEEMTGLINFNLLYDQAEINYLYVKDYFRGMKLGTILCNEMIEYCKKESVKSITLEVNKNNEYAINIYRKLGFIEVGVRKKYYNGEDAYLMEKVL